ncbi:DgyrCDS10046 [Dimorphilus gyrociliatus]|uniref:DgyrCDS10046 n=1 Tax=Dimorphilus gyrociliatus TaxID=2664684 RepID=A0A7I8VYZ1_9ANNE|nr:DgyrCDS10046 [Dimorphilus gyrociliatus]
MDQEENIYNLIPREYIRPPKPPRYTSKFKSEAKDDIIGGKQAQKTMGPPKEVVRQPAEFLKKNEKHPPLPEKKEFKYPDSDKRKPKIPPTDEKPVMGMRTTKNFITQNAVQNIMSVAKRPEKNYVDTRKGDAHALPPSGLEPKFINRKDYGEVPVYLHKRKEDMERAQQEYNAYVAEHFRRGAMEQLSDEIRQHIIDGLKANWEEIHREFQGLSVMTDTIPKKSRKERMEAEMAQLEKDIELMEKHPVIFIAN